MVDDSARVRDSTRGSPRTATIRPCSAKVKALRDSYAADERVSANRTIASMENRFATYPRIREQLGAWLAAR